MPATRTTSRFASERRKHEPYGDVELRQHPRGPLMYKSLDCVPHKHVRAEAFGKPYRELYSHLGQPEYLKPVPTHLRPHDPRPPPLNSSDFEVIRALGYGSTASVVYARTTRKTHPLDRPGTIVALKIVEKKHLREADAFEENRPENKHVERSVLTELPWNPFICGLIGTFVDPYNVYYAFEFCPQNSLRVVLDMGEPLEPRVAQFYFCGIVAGLAFLHDHDIVHRDVKPENVFLGPGGYPVLGDFGSARRLQDDFVRVVERDGVFELQPPALSFDWHDVGTFVYNAPEQYTAMTEATYVGSSVDWWAAGITLFEMLTRRYPFYSRDQKKMEEMIKRGRYRWPSDVRVGKTVKRLVAALLTLNPLERLGTHDVQEIMDYPWFENVDWAKYHSRQYVPPTRQNVYPGPGERWHELALPNQQDVPGLKIVEPPIELHYDSRFQAKEI
ncbi:kinase-like domain-containing protein [Lentinula raphanica]|nr:kinase-like domain-containing protein [Lentinula raphanica]